MIVAPQQLANAAPNARLVSHEFVLDSVENGALQRIESYGQQRGARTGAFGRVCVPVGSVARGHAQAVVGTENVKPGAVSHGRGGGRPRNKYTPHDQAHMLLFYEEQRGRWLTLRAEERGAEEAAVQPYQQTLSHTVKRLPHWQTSEIL